MARFLFPFIILFLPALLIAQQNYEPAILEKFTEVYFKEKELSKFSDEKVESLFNSYGITKTEYASYQSGDGRDGLESENMRRLNIDLQAYQKAFHEENNVSLAKYCNKIGLEFQLYLEIKQKYRQSIQFNRQLKPYFDKKLQSIHGE